MVCYGALRMPLALLELPLYVVLPALYGDAGLSLAMVGLVLFAARCIDACADPLIGLALARRGRFVHRRWILSACPLLAGGFWALLHPPNSGATSLAIWLGGCSILTYLAYSLASIAYQSWGTDLGEDAGARARVTAWREAFGLSGVLLGTLFLEPSQRDALALTLLGLTGVSAALLMRAPSPPMATPPLPRPERDREAAQDRGRTKPAVSEPNPSAWTRVLNNRPFRRLLLVFLINGTAAAIPATLLLFFVRDVLHAQSLTPVFLAAYFFAGALAMPLWVLLARAIGLRLAWLAGMGLAVAGFAWTLGLSAGDANAFTGVCIVTGLALGADLALPGAFLAQVIADGGDRGATSGAYVGLWNLTSKASLALAAGLALPLLHWAGYEPGQPEGELALSLSYGALPCALKLVASALLGLIPPQTTPLNRLHAA
jgi:hypothetical protein